MALKDLMTRKYDNFRGVDFSNDEVMLSRSPSAKNMWKNYKDSECIETRPGMTLLNTFSNKILGLFFYEINNSTQVLVHVGTKLLKWTNYPTTPATTTELFSGMNVAESKAFVFNNVLFILDGINYIEYNGTTAKTVVGTIPIVSYWKNPDGSTSIDDTTDTDLVLQDVNVLTSLRSERFIGDGTAAYQLSSKNIDSALVYLVTATVDGVLKTENTDFTVNRTTGVVTFNSAPAKNSKVIITYSKTTTGYSTRISNCTMCVEFDNRIFFSGNPDYPNAVFHCELQDPRYVRDTAYYECGLDLANIKALIPGNNALWVIKEINQNSSSVYYMTPTLDSTYDKIYPMSNGSISLGCVSTGINFNDDIVFFSDRGLEGISNSSLYSEQLLQHRSSLVDGKMIFDTDYKKVKLAEYNGYLLCLINSHVYLADSRQKFQNSTNNIEYEWYYWELPNTITYIKEYRGNLYLGNAAGKLFKLDGTKDNGVDIESVWTTPKDDFGYPEYTKTTNKRGNVANVKVMNNDSIHVDTIVDGTLKAKKIFSDTKGYLAYRIKDKKFKNIQIKFSSNKPFGLFSCTLQGFIAGYIKR
ncbi:MAG: DUF2460 domain-containing protein [Bacillota bacterium]|nr:DUF2460 domain-containing protein [Bacillota bacterium]